MIKRNLKKIIMILFIVIFGIFFIDSYMSTGVEEDFFTDIYLYLWNGNLNIVFLLVFLAIFHELCVMDSYKKIYNHFDRYVITRIGYKNFYKKEFSTICLKSFCYYYLLHGIMLLYCLIRYGYRTSTNIELFKYQLFSSNPLTNLILFIIISSFGLMILNYFIFSLSSFVKNIYLYRFTSIALLFITILVSNIFSIIIQNLFESTELIKTIGQSLMVTSLLQPGMGFMMYGFLNFSIAAIIYIILTITAISIAIKYRMEYDGQNIKTKFINFYIIKFINFMAIFI